MSAVRAHTSIAIAERTEHLKLTRAVEGNVSKKGKIWKVLLLEVFLLVGF